jgi:hypothetical protein
MSSTGDQILHTLAYFDIFRYPLTGAEINMFHGDLTDQTTIDKALDTLKNEGAVFSNGSFYALHNNPFLFERRIKGNREAKKLLVLAGKVGRFLYRFPFVRGVGISGSLSKQFAEADADLDFFIITSPNRVWVARTFLHILKKCSFLFRRQHWFCMNYFVSTTSQVIAEKNIFTATEVVTLLPVCGKKTFVDFFMANDWAYNYYPNMLYPPELPLLADRQGLLKSLIEKLLSGKAGDMLDQYWFRITEKRWKQKEKTERNSKGFPMGLKAEKQAARPRPEYFQQKILDAYAKKSALLDKEVLVDSTDDYFLRKEII